MTREFEDGVLIRPFMEGDRDAVNEFFDQMGGETRGFFNKGDGNRKLALKWFTPERDNWLEPFFVEKDGVMVGYIFLFEADTYLPELGIAVREDWKGKHLGRRLIQFLIDYTKERGDGGLMLTTSPANVRGWSLYSRMGFKHMGTYTDGELLFIYRHARD